MNMDWSYDFEDGDWDYVEEGRRLLNDCVTEDGTEWCWWRLWKVIVTNDMKNGKETRDRYNINMNIVNRYNVLWCVW